LRARDLVDYVMTAVRGVDGELSNEDDTGGHRMGRSKSGRAIRRSQIRHRQLRRAKLAKKRAEDTGKR
jgi:hypothetical protein